MLSSRSKQRQVVTQQAVIQVFEEKDFLSPNKFSNMSTQRQIITQQSSSVGLHIGIITQHIVVQA
jgi:hypothetical protein